MIQHFAHLPIMDADYHRPCSASLWKLSLTSLLIYTWAECIPNSSISFLCLCTFSGSVRMFATLFSVSQYWSWISFSFTASPTLCYFICVCFCFPFLFPVVAICMHVVLSSNTVMARSTSATTACHPLGFLFLPSLGTRDQKGSLSLLYAMDGYPHGDSGKGPIYQHIWCN